MATYKISDLFTRLCEISSDGYEYVDITLLPSDDGEAESLEFMAVSDAFTTDSYDYVDSCELSEDYDLETSTRKFVGTDYCSEVPFTYEEIGTIKHAVDNALEHFKDILDNPSESPEIKKQFKQSSVRCRNLQAKLAGFFKHIS